MDIALRNKTILIIEDDQDMLETMKQVLELTGYKKILTATTAAMGFAALIKNEVDVIVLDNNLPGMQGLDFMKKLQVSRKQIPVLMISGMGTKDIVTEAVKLGAIHFIAKPFEIATLVEHIDNLMREKDSAAGSGAATS